MFQFLQIYFNYTLDIKGVKYHNKITHKLIFN